MRLKKFATCLVIASLTFQEDGRTLDGTDPVTAVVVLQSIGADVIGVNCSTGPKEMIPVIRKMKEYAEVPSSAKPNAGLSRSAGWSYSISDASGRICILGTGVY